MTKRPIKILFDAVPLYQERPTGVGRTEAGLIAALAKNYPDDVELVGHYFDFLGRKKRRQAPTMLVHAPNIRYRRTVVLPGKVFNMCRRLRIPVPFEILVKERGDFHLFPAFLGWPSLFRTPSAPYIHDATYVDTPEYVSGPNLFDLRTVLPQVVGRSRFIITNTVASKTSLQRVYPEYPHPFIIAHIPPVAAVRLSEEMASERLNKLDITTPFLLFHATLEPRKNLPGLIAAYRSLPSEFRDTYSLVISGGKGWKDDSITSAIDDAKNDGLNIITLGYTSDEDRAALFMKATLYILPSFYEGFGMQLLEAFTYQTPVLASSIPVLREIGGDACAYCETDPESIRQAIVSLLSNPDEQQRLIHNGTHRLQAFDWDDVARTVYEHIRSVL
jgi:alpha-1,3-rhamnosyl/mannosyltransferase